MSKAEYNRQYRTPVFTAPLTQLSPDAGPTIIQYEAVTVYNFVNKKVRDVIDFLHEALLAHMKGVNNHEKFYHGKGSNNRLCAVLRYAMAKLRENRFVTLDKQLYDCICMRKETFMSDNESAVSIPNFDFHLRFQRNEFRYSGIAIYRNETDNNYFITPHLEIWAPYSSNADVTISTLIRIGGLFAVECRINPSDNNSPKLILITYYISPNSAMMDNESFIGKSLLPLSTAGSQTLADLIEACRLLRIASHSRRRFQC
ncbi:hypothetical protein PV326_008447 [Microctonus aethiopoides]|nr:hypothetical protein PV326_008447 [Microctonus aethiopoides]